MKIGMINGSPKVKESNSEYLLTELKTLIESNNEILEFNINKASMSINELKSIYDCDALVFAFPLYVDGIPSHLLSLLVRLKDYLTSKKSKSINIYVIANCGFYEGEQNRLAIEMIKTWCERSNLTWGQGIGTGAGEMLGSIKSVPIGHGPKKNLGKGLNILAENILNRSSGENIFISPNFPKFAFRFCANRFWNFRAKGNGLKKRDLFTGE